MQGTEKPDRELLDALGLCGALVREGSVYRFLAEHRLRLFGGGLFADLFGGGGRPSVPGSVIAVMMVLQALEGCSDREAVERLDEDRCPAGCHRGGVAPTAASRLARQTRDAAAPAPTPHRPPLDPTLPGARQALHLGGAASSHHRHGHQQPHLGLPAASPASSPVSVTGSEPPLCAGSSNSTASTPPHSARA